MFDYRKIHEYQISITNYCNAACPQCPRNINGGSVNPYVPLKHLSRDAINNAFVPELVSRMSQVFFCGGFGEPTMHPDFLDVLEDFRSKRSDLWIYIHSNGGTHDSRWWAELARIIGDHGKIDFGIDGLENTNHLYRRNVNWNTLISNATSFIKHGGNAQWNFIIFKHNQHQIHQAEKLSQQLGFKKFLPRRTGRFFDYNNASTFDRWPVKNKQGHIEYYLEPSDLDIAQNASLSRIQWIKQQPGGWKAYHDTTPITCDALMGNKVVITADGLILPCNFFEHHLYDARYHDPSYMPGSHDLCRNSQGRNQIRELLDSVGHDNLSIYHNSIENILSNSFWNTIVESWTRTLDQGRIYECANTCGEKFTKVWDQGGSTRP